jgi:hypothetical protein
MSTCRSNAHLTTLCTHIRSEYTRRLIKNADIDIDTDAVADADTTVVFSL